MSNFTLNMSKTFGNVMRGTEKFQASLATPMSVSTKFKPGKSSYGPRAGPIIYLPVLAEDPEITHETIDDIIYYCAGVLLDSDYDIEGPEKQAIVKGAALSVLANIKPYEPNNCVVKAFDSEKFKFTYAPLIYKISSFTDDFDLEFVKKGRSYLEAADLSFIFCIMTLFAVFKSPTDKGWVSYMTKRGANLQAAISPGSDETSSSLAALIIPINKAVLIHRVFNNSLTLSRCFVSLIRDRSYCQEDQFDFGYNLLFKMAKFSQMQHILLINNYLGSTNHLILTHRFLRKELELYGRALEYIESIPEADKPYIKLLYSQEESKITARSNFPMMADLAAFIGSQENKTLSNYFTTPEKGTLLTFLQSRVLLMNKNMEKKHGHIVPDCEEFRDAEGVGYQRMEEILKDLIYEEVDNRESSEQT